MKASEVTTGSIGTLIAVLIGIVGSGVLFSTSLVVPLIGFVSAFLAPAPLGFTRLRGGSAAAGFAALSVTLLLAVLFSPPVGAWYAVQCGLIGLVVPELLLRGKQPFRTVLWSTALALLVAVAMVTAFSINSGTDPRSFASKEITDGIDQAVKLYEQQSGLSSQDLELLRQGMQNVGQLMGRIYPALATINFGLISVVTLLLFSRSASRYGVPLARQPFREFRTPPLLVWLLIIAGFALLLPLPVVTTPAMNLLTVLGLLYFLQGLAVLLTQIDRTKFSGTFKVLLTILLLTQPYLSVIVAVIGVFDYWGEFRTPRTTQGENL